MPDRARTSLRRTVLATAISVAAAAGAGAPARAQGPGESLSPLDFYSVPDAVPDAPGSLVRSQSLPFALDLPVVLPARATRVMYTTTDAGGRRVPVTGSYLEPTVAWVGRGPRPLVALAPGTQGQGDQCAPSRRLQFPVAVDPTNRWSTTFNYELLSVAALLKAGYAVMMTDYQGLGMGDRVHTYVNRLEQGHAVLDAARVAAQVPGASVTAASPVVAWGYSQGGGAAGAAAELHERYAADVPLRAAVVGAPPADLQAVLGGIEGHAIAGVGGYAVNGLLSTNPEIRPVLEASMNAAGAAALQKLAQQCIVDSSVSFGFSRSTAWTKDGSSISQIIDRSPGVRAAVDAQRLGRARPDVPVLVTSDRADGTVPHAQVAQMASAWRALGADVAWRPLGVAPLPGDTDRQGIHHIAGMPATLQVGLPWVKDRIAG